MSFDDFCRCTPEEFGCVCKSWHDEHEAHRREEWERLRIGVSLMLMPYAKGKLSAKRLLPLPWDSESVMGEGSLDEVAPPIGKEAQLQRMAEIAKRAG